MLASMIPYYAIINTTLCAALAYSSNTKCEYSGNALYVLLLNEAKDYQEANRDRVHAIFVMVISGAIYEQ